MIGQEFAETLAERARRILLRAKITDLPLNEGGAKGNMYDISAVAQRDGVLPSTVLNYMALLSTTYSGSVAAGEPIEMFCLPALARFLFQNGDLLSTTQKNSLLAGLTAQQRLLDGGTLNHQHMRSTSWYLLAQYWPQATWTAFNLQTYSSAASRAIHKDHMKTRHNGFLQIGNFEATSTTYSTVNAFSAINAAEFADDPDVRRWGQAELDMQIALLRESSLGGIIGAPILRRNTGQINSSQWGTSTGSPAIAQHMLWLYYGAPKLFDQNMFRGQGEPFYITMMAQSKVLPSQTVLGLDDERPRRVYHRTGEFSDFGVQGSHRFWADTRFVSDSWYEKTHAICTANPFRISPYGFNNSIQNFQIIWKTAKRFADLTAYHPYFRGDSGVNAWSTDQWSPFVQYHRFDGNSCVLVADIPTSDPFTNPPNESQPLGWYAERDGTAAALHQLVQFRFPRLVDELVTNSTDVFIRDGDVYIAILVLNGSIAFEALDQTHTIDWRVGKVAQARTAIYFRVVPASSMSFAAFQADAVAKKPSYSSVTGVVTAGSTTVQHRITPRNESGEGLYAMQNGTPRVVIDGIEQVMTDESFVFDSGRVRIGNGKFELDGKLIAKAE